MLLNIHWVEHSCRKRKYSEIFVKEKPKAKLLCFSYLITDYERSNFSLSQCRFEDGVATDLVKIPSMTKISSRPSPNLIIGTSVGGAVLFILVILTLGFVIQRRRRKQNQTEQFETSSERPSSLEKPRVMTICSVREIDNNSLCGPIRELPDSGKVELLDENKPSGSGNEISEMPPSLTVMAHELRTHRSSKEQSMMRTHSANSFNILKSTSISRKSWTNMDLSDRSPRIETVISASARQKSDLNNRPTSTSPDTAEVSPLSMPKSTGLPDNPSITETDFPETSIPVSLDLNRSLPPTPISESPQVSPNSEGFSRALSLRKGSRNWSTAAGASVSVPDLPMVPASKFSEALRRHRQEGGYHSLKGLETTIPPGHPDLDESDVSAISSDEQILNTTWL